jgi:hypothetical protein
VDQVNTTAATTTTTTTTIKYLARAENVPDL